MPHTVGRCAALVLVSGMGSLSTTRPHAEGPPPGHTGGFGEPTCTACHTGAPLNDGVGTLEVTGLPATFEPEREYPLIVRLVRPGLRRAGFQLAVRLDTGDRAGAQAGSVLAGGDRVQVLVDGSRSVQYAQHTALGTTAADNTITWTVRWRAPSDHTAPVVVHVAANTSNDDDSELGDAVYTAVRRTAPR